MTEREQKIYEYLEQKFEKEMETYERWKSFGYESGSPVEKEIVRVALAHSSEAGEIYCHVHDMLFGKS